MTMQLLRECVIDKPEMTDAETVRNLRSACKAWGGQKIVAATLEVSAAYLSDVLRNRRNIGQQIAGQLGLLRVTTYIKQGWKSQASKPASGSADAPAP